jgi:futalosine hydrolase
MAKQPILIVAAVERELRPMKALIDGTPLAERSQWITTGAGKIASAIAVTRALTATPAACVTQIGCAGAFASSQLECGDVVIAEEEILADEGAYGPDGFHDLESIALPSLQTEDRALFNRVPLSLPTESERTQLVLATAGRFRVVSGRLATVAAASGDSQSATAVEERWHPLAESMEGAAATLAALASGCPAYEFRGISNSVGRRDRDRWEIDAACANAATIAHRFLELRFPPE